MILEPNIVPLAFFCSGKKIEAVVTALDWMTGLRTDPLVDLRMPISKTEPTGSIMVTGRQITPVGLAIGIHAHRQPAIVDPVRMLIHEQPGLRRGRIPEISLFEELIIALAISLIAAVAAGDPSPLPGTGKPTVHGKTSHSRHGGAALDHEGLVSRTFVDFRGFSIGGQGGQFLIHEDSLVGVH